MLEANHEKIKSKDITTFVIHFLADRNLNYEFYECVSEDDYDKRIVDGSPSTRENLAYQVNVHKNYLNGLRTGEMKFSPADQDLKTKSKQELLAMINDVDKQILDFLYDEANYSKVIKVPWMDAAVPLLDMIYGIINHEDYHLGRNSAMMEFLGIERSPNLKRVWG